MENYIILQSILHTIKWFLHIYFSVQVNFYVRVKAIYTLGHSVSLIALTTGSIILCLFRYVFSCVNTNSNKTVLTLPDCSDI